MEARKLRGSKKEEGGGRKKDRRSGQAELIDPITAGRNQRTTGEETIKED